MAVPLPWQVFRSPWAHRSLLSVMIKRDVLGRYRGSALGLLWSLFNPLLTLAVYTLVFGGILGVPAGRFGGGAGGTGTFAVFIFSGMIVYLLFAECTNRSPTLILQHANYVKRVVFPLEILPFVVVGSAVFHFMISMCVLAVASLVLLQRLPWTIVFFPLPLICLVVFIVGLSWFLSSLGVYLRDIAPTVVVITNLLLYLSPVLYPLELVHNISAKHPGLYLVFYANPLTFVILQMRDILFEGRLPNFLGLGIYFVCATMFAWLGLLWFQKTRKGFADVL
jgi:lipopolysaccharide transport system permease protein